MCLMAEDFSLLVFGILIGIPIGLAISVFFYQYLTPQQKPATTHMSNEEVLEWVDWKGRRRKATVHRDVTENG